LRLRMKWQLLERLAHLCGFVAHRYGNLRDIQSVQKADMALEQALAAKFQQAFGAVTVSFQAFALPGGEDKGAHHS
jgi:hypothetical protein